MSDVMAVGTIMLLGGMFYGMWKPIQKKGWTWHDCLCTLPIFVGFTIQVICLIDWAWLKLTP